MPLVRERYSLVSQLPDLINVHKRRGGAGIQSHVINVGMTSLKRGSQQLTISQVVRQFQFTKHTALSGLQGSYTHLKALASISSIHFKLERLKIYSSPKLSCYDLPPWIWGDVCQVRLDPRLPLFLVYVEKNGEPGDEARKGIQSTWQAQQNLEEVYLSEGWENAGHPTRPRYETYTAL